MDDVITKAIIAQQQDLKIGSAKLEVEGLITSRHADVQSQLLNEIKEKLYGRSVTAKGSIMFVHDELWFFPNQLDFHRIRGERDDLLNVDLHNHIKSNFI